MYLTQTHILKPSFKDLKTTIQLKLQLCKVKARKDKLKVLECYRNLFKYYMEINCQKKKKEIDKVRPVLREQR